MVPIWHAFDSLEPVVDSGSVELLRYVLFEGKMNYVEASVLRPLDPCAEGVDLEPGFGPVPSALALHDVEFTFAGEVKPDRHGTVADMASCSPHDDLVESVQPSNCQEISRVNSVQIYLLVRVLGSITWRHVVPNGLLQELPI